MPQRMGRYMLVDVSFGCRQLATDLNRGSVKWNIRRLAWEQIVGWSAAFPVLAEHLQ